MQIEIVETPPGEAPLNVREAWVGLRLPTIDERSNAQTWHTIGVVRGPASFFGSLFALLVGKTKPVQGFRVASAVAIDLLAEHSPEAAAWWRTNAPRFLEPKRQFLFHAHACRVIDDVTPQSE